MRSILAIGLAVAVTLCAGAALADKLTDAEDAFSRLDDETALRLCTQVLAETPADARVQAAAYFDRGEVYAADSKYDEAIADFSAALNLQPDPAQIGVHNARAKIYFHQHRMADALVEYEAELALHPTYYRALTGRALTLGLPLPPNPTAGRG